eukprot:2956659-Alexandrium_andersonii.AAC.1
MCIRDRSFRTPPSHGEGSDAAASSRDGLPALDGSLHALVAPVTVGDPADPPKGPLNSFVAQKFLLLDATRAYFPPRELHPVWQERSSRLSVSSQGGHYAWHALSIRCGIFRCAGVSPRVQGRVAGDCRSM